MPLLGLALGHLLRHSTAPWLDAVAPLVLLICGAVIVIVALRGGDAGEVTNSRWLLFGLPLSLSFDNLFAGIALGTLGFPVVASALTVGAISAGMCLLGLYLGKGLRHTVRCLVPERVEMLSGVLLLTLAVVHLF